jgi:hypothetical protein
MSTARVYGSPFTAMSNHHDESAPGHRRSRAGGLVGQTPEVGTTAESGPERAAAFAEISRFHSRLALLVLGSEDRAHPTPGGPSIQM